MTAREYLGQLKTLARNIDILYEEIARDRSKLESVTVEIKPDKVQTSKGGDRFADAIARLADKDLQRRDMILVYESLRDRIIDQILDVPNDLQGRVLYQRYVKFRSWASIAKSLNYSEAHLRRIHVQALATFTELFGPRF